MIPSNMIPSKFVNFFKTTFTGRLISYSNQSHFDLSTLLKSSGGTFIAKILGVGVIFIFQVILTQILEVEEYGNYVYVITWVNLLALFASFGFDITTVHLVAALIGKKQFALLHGYLKQSVRISVLVSLGTIFVFTVMLTQIQMWFTTFMKVLWMVLPLLLATVMLKLYVAQLRGLKCSISAEVIYTLLRPLITGLGVLTLFGILGYVATVKTVLTIELLVIIWLIGVAWYLQRHHIPQEIFSTVPRYETKYWLKIAFPLLLLSGFASINSYIDIVIIGWFYENSDIGIYSIVVKIVNLVSLGLVAVNGIVAPLISELYAKRQLVELKMVVGFAAWGIFVLSVPGLILVLIFGRELLGIFGVSFVQGYSTLIILACGQLVNILTGTCGLILTMTEYQVISSKIMGISALLNLVLNLILVPPYGINGAAFASATTTILWNIGMLLVALKKLNINPTIFQIIKC